MRYKNRMQFVGGVLKEYVKDCWHEKNDCKRADLWGFLFSPLLPIIFMESFDERYKDKRTGEYLFPANTFSL